MFDCSRMQKKGEGNIGKEGRRKCWKNVLQNSNHDKYIYSTVTYYIQTSFENRKEKQKLMCFD